MPKKCYTYDGVRIVAKQFRTAGRTYQRRYLNCCVTYSKRHNIFQFPALAEAIYGSFCKAENEIFNAADYKYFRMEENG